MWCNDQCSPCSQLEQFGEAKAQVALASKRWSNQISKLDVTIQTACLEPINPTNKIWILIGSQPPSSHYSQVITAMLLILTMSIKLNY